jgi:hypothetical protein
MLWGWWALENYAGITFRRGRVREAGEAVSIWWPLVGTPAAALGFGWWYWRDARFFARATVIPATIVAVGTLAMKGMRDVTFSYDVGGTSYTTKRSVDSDLASRLSEGQTVDIYVVTEKPGAGRLVAEYSS